MFAFSWTKAAGLAAIAGALLVGEAATLTPSGIAFAPGAYAQTQGMQRRDDRRTTRQGARSAKHTCNSQTDKSRAECRQTKRNIKQQGRQNRAGGG